MNPHHSLEKVAVKQSENIQRLLSRDGIARLNCFFSSDGTQQPSICGELGESPLRDEVVKTNDFSCVFGEMFKGKPILSGSSDLNQAQLIFSLVGTPTEENMPGWNALPGCDGVKNFGFKRGNLAEVFQE